MYGHNGGMHREIETEKPFIAGGPGARYARDGEREGQSPLAKAWNGTGAGKAALSTRNPGARASVLSRSETCLERPSR